LENERGKNAHPVEKKEKEKIKAHGKKKNASITGGGIIGKTTDIRKRKRERKRRPGAAGGGKRIWYLQERKRDQGTKGLHFPAGEGKKKKTEYMKPSQRGSPPLPEGTIRGGRRAYPSQGKGKRERQEASLRVLRDSRTGGKEQIGTGPIGTKEGKRKKGRYPVHSNRKKKP